MHFHITGHENILSKHKTTLEFTKDSHLTKRGTCIVGINADFDLEKIKKEFETSCHKIKITIECENEKYGIEKDEIIATYNPNFDNNKEMVIRLGSYIDDRTLATDATKSAMYLNKDLIKLLQQGKKGKVTIKCI